jgi:hypothetical protein
MFNDLHELFYNVTLTDFRNLHAFSNILLFVITSTFKLLYVRHILSVQNCINVQTAELNKYFLNLNLYLSLQRLQIQDTYR